MLDANATSFSRAEALSRLEDRLLRRYGELMSTEELARELKLKTRSGVRMARQRGRLPLKPMEFQDRRGQFYLTAEVANFISQSLPHEEEHLMDT